MSILNSCQYFLCTKFICMSLPPLVDGYLPLCAHNKTQPSALWLWQMHFWLFHGRLTWRTCGTLGHWVESERKHYYNPTNHVTDCQFENPVQSFLGGNLLYCMGLLYVAHHSHTSNYIILKMRSSWWHFCPASFKKIWCMQPLPRCTHVGVWRHRVKVQYKNRS